MAGERREIEVAFAIRAAHPACVAERIAALDAVADFTLADAGSLHLADEYYDLADRGLEQRQLALRLRTIGDAQRLALKGESEPSAWGGVSRLEIEEDWSAAVLAEILAALRKRGVDPCDTGRAAGDRSPREALRRLGYGVIQRRATFRRLRAVHESGAAREGPLAELAIDRVTYRFGGPEYIQYAVEVEALGAERLAAYRRFAEALRRSDPEHLRLWEHSKLATGKALEALEHAGRPPRTAAGVHPLTAADYDAIAAFLRRAR